jgi:hypothetical protein
MNLMSLKRSILATLLFMSVLALAAPLLFLQTGCAKKKVKVNPGGQVGQSDQTAGGAVESNKPALTADKVLAAAKKFGKVLAISLDKGIKLEATLAANGTIDKEVEPKIKEGLKQAKTAVDAFNVRAANYTTFDAASKADIAKLLDDTIAFLEDMNANGVLHIKNPNSQLVASGILLGASTAVDVFKLTFDQAQ